MPPQESINLIVYTPAFKLENVPVELVVPTPIGDGAIIEYLKGARPKLSLSSEILPLLPLSQVTSWLNKVNLGSL